MPFFPAMRFAMHRLNDLASIHIFIPGASTSRSRVVTFESP